MANKFQLNLDIQKSKAHILFSFSFWRVRPVKSWLLMPLLEICPLPAQRREKNSVPKPSGTLHLDMCFFFFFCHALSSSLVKFMDHFSRMLLYAYTI